jgi:hypothetical protein
MLPREEADVDADSQFLSARRVLDEDLLVRMTNDELDDIFGASPAGELPSGDLRGTALFFSGTPACRVIAHLAYWLAWQGKRVNPARDRLVNRITPLRLRSIRAKVSHGNSWVDGHECTVLDYSKTSWLARMVRDETRLAAPGLHLGVVWVRGRRVAWFALRAPTGYAAR